MSSPMTDAQRLADYKRSEELIRSNVEFSRSLPVSDAVALLMSQVTRARATRERMRQDRDCYRSQVLALHEADLAAATAQSEGRG